MFIDDQTSSTRWKVRSTQPPKKPCAAPATMPMIVAAMVTPNPNSTLSRKP